MDSRDITVLKHMLKYCNEISNTINRFAHGYGKMDSTKIFYTAVEDIPVVKEFIEKQLNNI